MKSLRLRRRRKPAPVVYDDAAKFAYVYPHLRTKEATRMSTARLLAVSFASFLLAFLLAASWGT